MRPWNMVMSALIALPLLAACGDEKEDGKDPGDTKTPTEGTSTGSLDSKKLSELTAAETKTLCMWGNTLGDDSLTADELCTQAAADNLVSSADECEEERDLCLEDSDAVTGDDDCTSYKLPKGCDVKVSILKKCISDIVEDADKAAKGATCETYEDHATPELVPASCDDVPLECLDFDVSISTNKTWRRG